MHKHLKRTTQCTATPDHRFSCHSFSDVVLVVLTFIVLWCQECKVDTNNFLHMPPEDDFEILFSAEQTGRILSITDSKSIQIDAKLLSYKVLFLTCSLQRLFTRLFVFPIFFKIFCVRFHSGLADHDKLTRSLLTQNNSSWPTSSHITSPFFDRDPSWGEPVVENDLPTWQCNSCESKNDTWNLNRQLLNLSSWAKIVTLNCWCLLAIPPRGGDSISSGTKLKHNSPV